MNRPAILLSVLALAGCGAIERRNCEPRLDQELRREIFDDCLDRAANLKEVATLDGKTKSDGAAAEIIKECRDAAYWMALRFPCKEPPAPPEIREAE